MVQNGNCKTYSQETEPRPFRSKIMETHGHWTSICNAPIGLERRDRHGWSWNCEGCLGGSLCMPRCNKELVDNDYLTDRTLFIALCHLCQPVWCAAWRRVPSSDLLSSQHTPTISRTLSQMAHHLYADDTQMLAKATLQSLGACCRQLEACKSSVQRWCAARRLQLNPDKTEFMFQISRPTATSSDDWSQHQHRCWHQVCRLCAWPWCTLGEQTQHAFPHQQDRLDLLFHLKKTASSRHTVDHRRLVSAIVLSRIDYLMLCLPVTLASLSSSNECSSAFCSRPWTTTYSDTQREQHCMATDWAAHHYTNSASSCTHRISY